MQTTRRSGKAKRNEDDYERDEDQQEAFDSVAHSTNSASTSLRTRHAQPTVVPTNIYADSEGDALLATTAHIWTEPLHNYALTLHAKQRRLEQDFELNEQSRKYFAGARVTEFVERRIQGLQDMQESRGKKSVQNTAAIGMGENETIRKELEREAKNRRTKETREAVKEEQKRRKEKEDATRRARAEELRLFRLAEAHRRAALTPEGRALEDHVKQEQLQRERAAKMLEMAGDFVEAEGRGARTKRKRESNLEEDAARALSGLASLHGAHGEDLSLQADDDGFDDGFDYSGPSKKAKGKSTARVSNPVVASERAIDEYGTLLSDLPPGSYLGLDGVYYDAEHVAIEMISAPSPPASFHQAGYDSAQEEFGLDSEAEEEDYGGEDEDLPIAAKGVKIPTNVKKTQSAIEALEKKIWTQIAKRDILKVSSIVLSFDKC